MTGTEKETAPPLAVHHPTAGPCPPGGEPPFLLIPERMTVRVGDREVRVSPTQFRLLAVLLETPGRAFPRAELIERAIGGRVTRRTIDVHIKELRRKLGPHGSRIETVRGYGYRYRGETARPQEASAMAEPSSAPKRLLFVCVENSNRSQMAEAFARLHGGDRVEAYSAGSRPSGRVNPRAVEFMREVGYDLTRHRSKALADLPAGEFEVVVGMGCGDEGCPLVKARRHEEWGLPDPKEMPPEQYREVRDLIERKVKELLAGL